ncbi:CRISPR-associated protein Cmr3 [Bathymodiolus japonicus methanotrophic gill symbiont]|uniref:type III-B CRISPR module-associated Cmr3 family protein n=1 Tax=Bathymodiolus japonicus methanotrophic gill symbiont TaxID=113269 RepID=UPI001B501897|nr:type III-B CRISPR module-associated Cmr3 family protein [Bathymodiolus japonicus methanotrophic gill symbiont]GFO73305.1 CRISPR-associated protein Cmr3 [Bathymodiolus japonicus methanotrophic gill symbiont]
MAKYRRKQKEDKQKPIQKQTENIKQEALAKGQINLQLHPFDTWFFRESRPHDAAGASELSSLFPPPIRTLAGALRTFLGDQMEIDWKTLQCKSSDFDFEKSLGNVEHLGQLQLNGAWICYQGQRLYPAPLYLMQKEENLQRLLIGKSVRCDLGTVRLPEMPKDCVGYKNLEQHWLTAAGMRLCLEGQVPNVADVVKSDDLFSHEARLGIARDNEKRKVIDGKLYQTQHLRLKDEVHIELDVKNLGASLLETLETHQQNTIWRLGGEGRMASVAISDTVEPFPFIKNHKTDTLVIHFVTAAGFGGKMFPENFIQSEQNGQTVWQGEINGIELKIEAAVIGKAHREGGWDMKNHQPRPVKSYIPAGSAWFCRLTNPDDYKNLHEKLHGHCMGIDSAYGRGQILIGQWQDTDNQ